MNSVMIFLFHEKPHSFLNPLRGNSRAPFIIYPPEPDSIYRNKGRGPVADVGRSASKLDLRYPWDVAPDVERVDTQGERKGVEDIRTPQETRSACSPDAEDSARITRTLGEVPFGVRAESSAMGRSHAGGTPEAAVRDNAEGSSGPGVDASIGIPAETGQLFISSGTKRGCEAVSSGVKKNCRLWAPRKRSCLRMKRASPSILV